jgi:hypothetical protein
VKMWATPTTSDRYSAHMKPNEKGVPHDIAKGNLRGEDDVANPKLVSSDSISDSGSNTKTESEQGPILIEAVVDRMLPTPTARDWKGARKPETLSREEREQLASGQDSSLSNTKPGVGGMADGIPTRLDGHLGFEQEPNIPRVATGIPDRVNRLKVLGNSIVPQIVYNIGLAILEEEKRTNVTK